MNLTATAPVIDGVVSPNEWSGAATAAGSWGVLRETATDVDTENNRFRMMWDSTNLYILYETDFGSFTDTDVSNPNPNISFGADNLNLYIDPNEDDEPNFLTDPENNVDGYQFAFNQYHNPSNAAIISTNADRQGTGFFTEAHHNTPFGDQARWNNGLPDVTGPALQNIVVAQTNGTGGGVAEIVFPWANFNALAFVAGPTTNESDFNRDGLVDGADFSIWQRNVGLSTVADNTTGDANVDGTIDQLDLGLWEAAYGDNTQVPTGLNAVEGPTAGDEWFFNMSRINGQGDNGNFLPIWNWHEGQSFAPRPHGVIKFVGAGVSGVPEPATLGMVVIATAALGLARRRRMA